MLRLTAIFIAICVILIAGSLGAVGYLVFGLTVTEAVDRGAYHHDRARALQYGHGSIARSQRCRRTDCGPVARVPPISPARSPKSAAGSIAIEHQETARRARSPNDPLAAEIGELGVLIKQLAETVAIHDARLPVRSRAPARRRANRSKARCWRRQRLTCRPIRPRAASDRCNFARLRCRANCQPPDRSRARAPTRSRRS